MIGLFNNNVPLVSIIDNETNSMGQSP